MLQEYIVGILIVGCIIEIIRRIYRMFTTPKSCDCGCNSCPLLHDCNAPSKKEKKVFHEK